MQRKSKTWHGYSQGLLGGYSMKYMSASLIQVEETVYVCCQTMQNMKQYQFQPTWSLQCINSSDAQEKQSYSWY